MDNALPKIIVVVGPTASGKTDLAILLAKRFKGEIISADSRQVYTKMTVGTAKPQGRWQDILGGESAYTVAGVPHYIMDIIGPGQEMSVANFKKLALEHIADIKRRGKLPIIVGGTGQYIWSVVDNLEIPRVEPNAKLRASLSSKSLFELQALLKNFDPASYAVIDIKNPRRVLRALEVVILTGASFVGERRRGPKLFDCLKIGIKWPLAELNSRIDRRVDDQMAQGLKEETEALIKQKFGWNLPSMSSIGYRQMGEYWRGESTLSEAVHSIKKETRQYAKRQITWFKRDKDIVWLNGLDTGKAESLVEQFIR